MYNCPANINVFCYCCGRFTPASEKHGSISDDFTVAYRHYFDREVILNVPWAPNIVCRACYVGLVNWLHKKQSRMPFGMPMLWHNPEEHDPKNCYSCANTVIGLNKKKVDSSKFSLKTVLLDKTNSKPSVPIAYGTDTKETFEKMDRILKLVDYQNHNWRVCCDLKVIAMLTGLQVGYIKHMCFLCDWDSRYKGDQYQKNDWKMRDESEKKDANRIHKELVSSKKIILPPLHIKLGIVKNFLMVVAKRDEGFSCLRDIFPKISDAKLKNGVLNGPNIRKLVKSEDFNRVLINNEIVAWESLKEIIVGLLGKHRSPNYKESVRRMLYAFSKIGVHMSLKIHFLHQHLDYFSQQLSTESDEQGERYHQTAMPFESRYRGKRAPGAILAEICWWSKHIFQYDQEENEGKWSNQEEKEYEVEEEETGMEFFTDESDYSDNDDVEIQSLSKRARL